MKKKSAILLVVIIFSMMLSACVGGDKSDNNGMKENKSEKKYVLATDDDFMLYSDFLKRYEYDDSFKDLKDIANDASWYYIGEAEYVEIPEKIHGEEVIKYGGMFAHNTTVKGVKSTNSKVRTANGMFQFMDLTENGGVLDLTKFDFSSMVEGDSMFKGVKLDTIIFGDTEFSELVTAEGWFESSKIKNLDLSTLTFPKLTRPSKVFYGYKGDKLNANIPSLPSLVEINMLIDGEAEIENLQINDLDLSNVSQISVVFGSLQLGGDAFLDLSNWTLPNIERREIATYHVLENGEIEKRSANYLQAQLIAKSDAKTTNISGVDLSSLDGAINLRDLITSDNYKKIKVKGQNEYKAYQYDRKHVEESLEINKNDLSRPEIYASEEKRESSKKIYERRVQNLEEFELEVAE